MSTDTLPHPLVVELQTRMFRARMNPNEVAKEAGIGRATWWRWTKGTRPNLATLDRMVGVVARRESAL